MRKKINLSKTVVSKEFRGIPLDEKIYPIPRFDSIRKRNTWLRQIFRFGNLLVTSNFNGDVLPEGELEITCSINYLDQSQDYGLQEYKTVIVNPSTVGQLIGYTTRIEQKMDYRTARQHEERIKVSPIYEGDVFEISDWPGCFFEYQWSEREGTWIIKLLYGSHGFPNFRGYKTPISECSNPTWNQLFTWYPKEEPRFENVREIDWADRFIFLGPEGSYDVYVESEMGDIGEVMLISKDEKYTFHYQDLPDKYPGIVEKLKERMLWD